MTIVLQQTEDPVNMINKTISNKRTCRGTLKEQSSILRPTITLAVDASTIADCNYMTIDEFGRQYFITDIRSIRNNLTEVSGRVDVLQTYADAILANRIITKRQENVWNLYLDDGSFHVYNNPNVLAKVFPSGFNTLEFVLAIAGS